MKQQLQDVVDVFTQFELERGFPVDFRLLFRANPERMELILPKVYNEASICNRPEFEPLLNHISQLLDLTYHGCEAGLISGSFDLAALKNLV